MISPNEFWLEVHRLAVAYDCEGLSPGERTANILQQFREMPRAARREVLGDLLQIINHCPNLYALAVTQSNEADGTAQGRPVLHATHERGGGS